MKHRSESRIFEGESTVESSWVGQRSIIDGLGDSADERERSFHMTPVLTRSEYPLGIEDNVTEIDTEIEEDISANQSSQTESRLRRSDNPSYTEGNALNTELEILLDHPLLYSQDPRFFNKAAFQDFPDAHWPTRSGDMREVERSKLRRMSIHQIFGLVQLLYRAAVTKQEKSRKLEDDLRKTKSKQMTQRAELRAEKNANRKYQAAQAKKYKTYQDYFVERLDSHVPKCTICLKEQIDTALECGHVFCTKCLGTWKKSWCPLCRQPKGNVRRLYFS